LHPTGAAHESSFGAFQAKFKTRVAESAAHIKAAKAAVGPAASFMGRGEARAASTELAAEYKRLTQ